MNKILYIGDVHATPEELVDCQNLVNLVVDVCKKEKPDKVCFLGDLYHTHAVIRVEVMDFWKHAFAQIKKQCKNIWLIVGNHDQPGIEGSTANALMAHLDECRVVDRPIEDGGIIFMPYYFSVDKFVEDCNKSLCKTLVCHQTFIGAKYENGYYVPENEGVNPNLLKQEEIISGHIHLPSEFSKVKYIGAPRWRTVSDANIEREIWLVSHDEDGKIIEKQTYSTGQVCKQIRYLIDTPEEPIQIELDPKHKWRIDIKGPFEYIRQRKSELSGPGIIIRSFPTKTVQKKVKESQGIENAFKSYVEDFVPKFGTDKTVLKKMVKERFSNAG